MFDLFTSEISAQVDLSAYAESAYLAYSMSVVMGRALPMLCDGQKPVQRRIIYTMHRMGLSERSKAVKSARIVGDCLGKYHPHGDSSVYDAAVRMSQDFSLRYPIIDGQGNFGSRDGDSAAAMRYTEARLTPFAELLLGELDQGTVDFVHNYDGSLLEPVLLPARLPVLLLNGASGIAVGMATEIVSHNLTEVANACEYLIKHPEASLADILQQLPGPDFACGGQIISSNVDIEKAYATGRGAFRARARWSVEPLARGQWQLAITELPPDTSTAKVMSEIEALTNPQIKAGKKALTQEQLNLKALVLSVVDRISDDSDAANPVRLIIEPKSSKQTPEEVMQVLLAHTSLEANVAFNLVTIGQDLKPQQKSLMQILHEWVAFRYECVTRRTQHRLGQVRARKSILQGRLVVFLHLDEVIDLIRHAQDPKEDLIAKFGLVEAQANDILELKLRQLAGLEKLKLDAELADLTKEESALQAMLDKREVMTRQILAEITADRKKYGDPRRTLIEASDKVTTSDVVATSDDPVTLIVSKQGWIRSRQGHKLDLSALTWKPGDTALSLLEARSPDTVVVFDQSGRVYNLAASSFPSGRGDGVPLSSLVDMAGNSPVATFVLDESSYYFLASTGGYGFVCPSTELRTKLKSGKAVVTLDAGESLLSPVALTSPTEGEVAIAASNRKLLLYPLDELKQLGKGKGVQLISLSPRDTVTAIAASNAVMSNLVLIPSQGSSYSVVGAELAKYRGKRARAGAAVSSVVVGIQVDCFAR